MRTTRPYSFIIVKTAHAPLFLLLASIAATQAQAPPVLSATNDNAAATTNAAAATNAAATNITIPATNDLATRRRAFQQSLTNRLSRMGTNQFVLPALPTPVVSTNAVPITATVTPINPALDQATNAQTLAGNVAAAPAAAQTGAVPGPLPATPTGDAATPSNGHGDIFLKFFNAPIDQIFEKYSDLTGRTVLRPASLQASITIINYTPLNRIEAIQALDGALALNGITMIPQGEKFVKAVLYTMALAEGANVAMFDAGQYPDAEQFVTHIVQLKTVKPSEVAQVLASFSKNPAGIVPIDSNQLLVLRDYASNIRRMLDLIKQVDVTVDTDYKLEVIPIKYGKVADLFDTMNTLISGSAGGGGAARTGAAAQRQTGQLPRPGTAVGTSSRYGTSGTSRTGALGQPQAGQPFQQVGGAQPGTTPGTGTFQGRLQQILNRAAGASEIQLLTDARIVPDERSNSLIVFANKQDMQMITNIVAKVDMLLAQVLIEGLVVGVTLSDKLDLGVSWLQKPNQFSPNFSGAGAVNNGQGFFNNLTNFSLFDKGFSYFGSIGDNYEVAVKALASDGRARILQRPRVQTSHAVPGVFFTGQTVPYVSGFYDYGYSGGAGGGVTTRGSVELLQVGVTLNVTPFITPDGLVVLDVVQDISSLDGFVDVSNGQKAPQTSTSSAQATLSVRDGETIILGGYVKDSRIDNKSGVPILKDIPLLGSLFRSKSKDNSRTELILLLKVTVLKDPADASHQVEKERAKLPGLSDAAKEFKETEDQSIKKATESQPR
jgi:general secretion pathway protein D